MRVNTPGLAIAVIIMKKYEMLSKLLIIMFQKSDKNLTKSLYGVVSFL